MTGNRREPPWTSDPPLTRAATILGNALAEFRPTHIVSMVSGGKDSAASHAIAQELGIKIDLVIHGRTGCGIPDTTEYVKQLHEGSGLDFVIADAGSAYEDYVLRKGFFGKGRGAHNFAYRVLKATPFRKAISKEIRRRRRDIRILLLNGARAQESVNRQKHLHVYRQDPAAMGNIWVNLIHDWSASDRDKYLESRGVPTNPVSDLICRSGECMCGTMQSRAERIEAAAFFPKWGAWLDDLENTVRAKHGFGWGEPFPRRRDERQADMFQPMCVGCTLNRGEPYA